MCLYIYASVACNWMVTVLYKFIQFLAAELDTHTYIYIYLLYALWICMNYLAYLLFTFSE